MNKQIWNLVLALFLSSTSLLAQEASTTPTEPVKDTTEGIKPAPQDTTGLVYVLRHPHKKGKILYDPRVIDQPIDTLLKQGYYIVDFHQADENKPKRFWKNLKQAITTLVDVIKIYLDLRDLFNAPRPAAQAPTEE